MSLHSGDKESAQATLDDLGEGGRVPDLGGCHERISGSMKLLIPLLPICLFSASAAELQVGADKTHRTIAGGHRRCGGRRYDHRS